MFKKIVLSFLVTIFLLTILTPTYARAEESGEKWYAPTYEEFTKKVFGAPDSEIFGERYTMAQVFWIINSLPHVLTGSEVGSCLSGVDAVECMKNLTAERKLNGPLFALAAFTDSLLTTKPASGIEYVADRASRLHLIPRTYAQEGFGFESLSPTLQLWKVVRNFSYALLAIAMVVLALMIMFRIKLSPQTVISVQSALPRIVVALLLITFSYAIAGLLVDLMYVILGIVSLLAGGEISQLTTMELFIKLTSPATGYLMLFILIVIVVFTVLGTLGAGVATVLGGPTGIAAAGFGFFIFLFGLLAIGVALIRILWLLIKSYVTVILLIIVAPLFILIGSIQIQGGFGTWLRNLLANLIVFPLVGIMVFLANFFAIASLPADSQIASAIAGWDSINPFGFKIGLLEGSTQLPAAFGPATTPAYLGIIIGFGIVMMIPSIGNMLKEIFKTPTLPFGSEIGKTTGIPWVSTKAGVSGISAGVEKHGRDIAKHEYVDPKLIRILKSTGIIRT